MKVTNAMIAKDLRFLGRIYKHVFTYPNLKRSKNVYIKPEKQKRKKRSTYIKRPDGTYLRLLIKKPKDTKHSGNLPGTLWIHGGGYFSGIPEQVNMAMIKSVKEKSVIVSPDYRLSTEAPYPAALEDCYLALVWMKDHAKELGINPNQLFVGGESAGGGLTAALCLYARDKEEVSIAFQMPLYPMIDARMDTKSMKGNNAPVWNEEDTKKAWGKYLNNASEISAYASPALTKNYKKLPPAMTFVGDIEPFYDETLNYMKRLEKEGIPVFYKVLKGCFHGFDMLVPWSAETKEAKNFFIEGFDHAVENYFSQQE